MSEPRWPLFLWAAQLVVPGVIAAYSVVRVFTGPALWRFDLALLAACAVWLVAAIAPLVVARGRRALVHGRQRVVLVLGGAFAAAVVTDVVLTLTGLVPTVADAQRYSLRYRSGLFTSGRLEPNQVVTTDRDVVYEINGRGFRGPEIAVPKPEGVTRIVFLGGSQVFDQYGPNWPIEVGVLLSRAERPVDVVNAGLPSHRTSDSLGKLLTDVWLLEPDVIVLCQAWNDIKYFARITPETPFRDVFAPSRHDWRLEPEGLDRLLCASAAYRLLRTRYVRARWGNEGELGRKVAGRITEYGVQQYRHQVELVCELAANLGAKVVLCKQPRKLGAPSGENAAYVHPFVWLEHDELLAAFAACDRVLEEVARRRGCDMVDLHRALAGRQDWFADTVHFTPEGSRQVARILADALVRLGILGP